MPPFTMPTTDGSTYKAPLSGNVDQTINPWTWFYRMAGAEIGQLNVYLGDSSNPALERQILETVGTYGRQLGRIGDALAVLLRHTKRKRLTPEERDIIAALEVQLATVDRLKRQANIRPALDPPSGDGISES